MSRNLSDEDLALGERLTLASCRPCHLGIDDQLSGKQMKDVPSFLGKIYSSNITSDASNGIGHWSRSDLDKLLRTGIKPDGKKANMIMPRYTKIAQSDMDAIMDYLQSGRGAAAPSSEPTQISKLKLPAKMASKMKKIRTQYSVSSLTKPDTLEQVAYGK